MDRLKMFVNGQRVWTGSGKYFEAFNRAQQVIAHLPKGTRKDAYAFSRFPSAHGAEPDGALAIGLEHLYFRQRPCKSSLTPFCHSA